MNLYFIYDEVGETKVSSIFEAENVAIALRYFKGFLANNKLPIPDYELSLRKVGSLSGTSIFLETSSFIGEINSKGPLKKQFSCQLICYGHCIDEQYNLCLPEHIQELKLKVEKNITEAEFDEAQKNAN